VVGRGGQFEGVRGLENLRVVGVLENVGWRRVETVGNLGVGVFVFGNLRVEVGCVG